MKLPCYEDNSVNQYSDGVLEFVVLHKLMH